jgi:hypothetical protein
MAHFDSAPPREGRVCIQLQHPDEYGERKCRLDWMGTQAHGPAPLRYRSILLPPRSTNAMSLASLCLCAALLLRMRTNAHMRFGPDWHGGSSSDRSLLLRGCFLIDELAAQHVPLHMLPLVMASGGSKGGWGSSPLNGLISSLITVVKAWFHH